MNHNVRLSLQFSLWENLSSSVRSGDILSAYLYLKTNDNAIVGYTQGLNGIAQMAAALPAGVLTDRHRRDTMLRASALVGLLAGGFLAYTLLWQPTLRNLCLAMVALGAYRGIYNPPLESIFADSVQAGRSSMYTRKYIVTILASGCGPLLSLLLFWRLGNHWETAACRHVLLWGLGIMVTPLAIMCCFDDSKALGHHSDSVRLLHTKGPEEASLAEEGSAAHDRCRDRRCCRCCCLGSRLPPGLVITLLISVSDLIGAFASGMTLKFFALFFIEVCQVSPALVSLLGVLGPLSISAASFAAQHASRAVGRLQLSLVTRACDVVLLVCMASMPTASASARLLLMGVHLVRMALANCSRPLMRSILMDAVPKRHRGKVNAVESVRAFSWSGSAAIGGVLVERFGFQGTFLITSCIKLLAFVPLIFLMRYVPDGWLVGGRASRAAEAVGYSMLPENAAAEEAEEVQEEERVQEEGLRAAGAGCQECSRDQRDVVDAGRLACGEADGLCEPLLGEATQHAPLGK